LDQALSLVILFDLDGTLIDSTDAILSSFKDSFDDFSLPQADPKKIKSLIGHPLDYMYRELGVDERIVWDMVDCYKSHYRNRSKQMTRLLPKAKEAIEEASSFARLGIVTTKTARYSKELMDHFGLMDHFEVLVGREDVKHPKPHPQPIEIALQKMGIEDRESVWMIGDTCLDIISAKRAGVKSVAVLSGYASKEDLLECKSEILRKETHLAIKYIKNSNKADIK